jgi:hypothetical protein
MMRSVLAGAGMVALSAAALAALGASPKSIALILAGGGALLIVCLLAYRSMYDRAE